MTQINKTFAADRSGKHGTIEWADKNYNICLGCEHGCLYCFAKAQRNRFDPSVALPGAWLKQRLNPRITRFGAEVRQAGVVMFPSTHDITPAVLPESVRTIRNLLAKNQVLIVTKPHLSVVRRLCKDFADQRAKILFRFTIGALAEPLCAFWEPGAPTPGERINALRHAHKEGFATSVSVEPMVDDVDHTLELVYKVDPFVTDSIWIGKMQRIPKKLNAHIPGFIKARNLIRHQQRDVEILRIVARLKPHPKVKWKDSIQKVIAKHAEAGSDCSREKQSEQ